MLLVCSDKYNRCADAGRSVCLQDLTAALVARVQAGPTEVVEELKARLALKEKLFQELLSDRSRQSNENQAQVQDLLNTLSCKDQYLQVRRVVYDVHSRKKVKHVHLLLTFLPGLLLQAVCGDKRADRPAAGAPPAAGIKRAGLVRAEVGHEEGDRRRDGASA